MDAWGHDQASLKKYGCLCYSLSVLKKYPKFGTYACVTLVGLFLAWYLFTLTANQTFCMEEWKALAESTPFPIKRFFSGYSGHPTLLPSTIYLGIFRVFGLDSYIIFRLVLVIFHLGTIFLVFGFIRRRHGWIIGTSVAIALALLGTGAQMLIWPSTIGPIGSFLFFLISLRCFEKAESSQRIGWALASCIALSISAFSADQGTGALFALCVLTLFGGNVKRRWWVSLLPTFTFIIWYLSTVASNSGKLESTSIIRYAWSLASEGAAGLFGTRGIFGGVALVGIFLYLIVRWRRGEVTLRSSIFLIYLCAYWGAIAYGRAGMAAIAPASSSRYVYFGAISLVLLISENIKSQPEGGTLRSQAAKLFVLLLAALSIWGTHSSFTDYKEFHSALSLQEAGRLVVAESHRDDIDGEDVLLSFVGVTVIAKSYFHAIDYYKSSPVTQFRDLAKTDVAVRVGADSMLFEFGFAAIDGPLQKNGDCLRRALDNQPLVVSPGSHVEIHVSRTTAVYMARFTDLNSWMPLFKEILEPGSYVISLDADDLGESLRVKFDDPTAVMSCD